jgi:putative protease
MTKILVCPTSISNLKELLNEDIDGIIVGLKKYSVFLNLELSIESIEEITKITNKEIYIAINKPLYNKDIDKIKIILEKLKNLRISGILYEDISIVNINKELNLDLNLVWNQIHIPTNYTTCNYWYKKGIKNAVLSTELMLQDYINIKKNTKMKLMVYIYGHLPMFESSRELLSNYFEFINKDKKNKLYYIYEPERDKYYPIYEHNNETYILDDIINGIREIKEIKENNIDYIIINGLLHKSKHFIFIVKCYIEALKNNNKIDELYEKINNKNTGFLYKETIYRVKNEQNN